MNVSDAFRQYLAHCRVERHVSDSSLEKYRDCFSSWLSRWFGEHQIEAITRHGILDMRQAMIERQLSAARQYSVIMCLKSLLKFCRSSLGVICLDPTEIISPKRKTPQVEFLNNEEIERMLNAIDTSSFPGIRLRALVEVLLSTGMRISEAVAL